MALVFTGRESEREKTEKLNALASAVTRWEKMAVGPGLELRNHSGGMLLNVKQQEGGRKTTSEDCSGGDLQTISNTIGTQDSDTWTSSSGKQVAIDLITDISWDAVNGLIVGRMRTLTFDKCGNLKSIGGEGTLVTLITTESCAAP